jgi:hypothetical protein
VGFNPEIKFKMVKRRRKERKREEKMKKEVGPLTLSKPTPK